MRGIPGEETTPAGDKLVVGVTGAIGAGKSTVAARLGELGAEVIDADRVGKEVLRRRRVVARLTTRFGEEILATDGAIDRKKLGAIVFADPDRRRELERVVHPVMRSKFEKRIERASRNADIPLVVLDAAILFEAKWDSLCAKVIFVDAPRPQRLRRVSQSRGWTSEELALRERAQWPLEEKRRRADAVLDNEGPVDRCLAQVDSLYRQWVGEPASTR